MRKLFCCILACLLLAGIMAGCGSFGGKKEKIQKIEAEMDDTLGIVQNKLVYFVDKENFNDTADRSVWTYDLENGTQEKIGTIENWNADSTYHAIFPSGKIYMSCGVYEDSNPNKHYEFDIVKKEMRLLSTDEYFQPLIYNIAANERQYVQFKPEPLPSGGWRYSLLLGEIGKDGLEELQVREGRTEGENAEGEFITTCCIENQIIYTYETQVYPDQTQHSYICSYDLQGNPLSKEPLPKGIREYMDTKDAYFYGMKKIGEYFFFTTNDLFRSCVMKKEAGDFRALDSFEKAQYFEVPSSNIDATGTEYFINREEQKLYSFDLESEELKPMEDIPYPVNFAITGYGYIVFQNDEGYYFFKI